ncbi:acyltransferase [Actinotalea sp. BY-33]|uniref:Acyltransferase n=2 Tax=Actinotalea soli TaxID=2819234 RepID=A0A939LNR5_9CELL|nr:acyltransferase [Actinotalea soli]
MTVVLFHLWPDRLTGGYVGVDVFFVISGFLITSHLVREMTAKGRISLGAFWARRVRRLLPAAGLVLVASLLGTLLVAPRTLWQPFSLEIGASAVYVQNWVLAGSAVDYFAQEVPASPVQHYWSLSVEEQFYLGWPLLMLGLLVLARRAGLSLQRTLAVGLVTVLALSLAHSIHATLATPSSGYFSTFTHAWEFAAGGLLALATRRLASARWAAARGARVVLSWTGLALIVVAVLVFDGGTPFPGYLAAIPVLGTLAVIAAGMTGSPVGPDRVMTLGVTRAIGNASYSLYLWHWPLIVLVPYALGRDLTLVDKLGVLLASVVLAFVTKAMVEDRFRGSGGVRTTYLVAGVVTAAMVAACFVAWQHVENRTTSAYVSAEAVGSSALAGSDPCLGAMAMEPGGHCPDSHRLREWMTPEFASGDGQDAWIDVQAETAPFFRRSCALVEGTVVEECRFGSQDPSATVALVGDSHARHLTRAVAMLAEENNWAIRVYGASSCRPAIQTYTTSIDRENREDCQHWKRDLVPLIAEMQDVDVILTAGATKRYAYTEPAEELPRIAEAFAATWRIWTAGGTPVVAVVDVPISMDRNVPDCIAAAPVDEDPCTLPRAEAAPLDPIVVAMESDPVPGVTLLDMTDSFCDEETCHFVIGGIMTHKDTNHITSTFGATLAPQIREALVGAMDR